ncbi:hypothetical protein B0H14DRAFT_3133569, partial [Mycena olivaceomarginata]
MVHLRHAYRLRLWPPARQRAATAVTSPRLPFVHHSSPISTCCVKTCLVPGPPSRASHHLFKGTAQCFPSSRTCNAVASAFRTPASTPWVSNPPPRHQHPLHYRFTHLPNPPHHSASVRTSQCGAASHRVRGVVERTIKPDADGDPGEAVMLCMGLTARTRGDGCKPHAVLTDFRPIYFPFWTRIPLWIHPKLSALLSTSTGALTSGSSCRTRKTTRCALHGACLTRGCFCKLQHTSLAKRLSPSLTSTPLAGMR